MATVLRRMGLRGLSQAASCRAAPFGLLSRNYDWRVYHYGSLRLRRVITRLSNSSERFDKLLQTPGSSWGLRHMLIHRFSLVLTAIVLRWIHHGTSGAAERWTPQQANDWYDAQPWLVGCDFLPSTAINQLEMWQPDTFDPTTIDRELGWAESIGFNTVRVFLHDLPWQRRSRRVLQERRQVPRDRRPPQNPPDARLLRRRVGPRSAERPAAPAARRRSQQRLGAKPGPRRAGRSCQAGCARAVRHRRAQALRQRQARARLGFVQRSRTTSTATATARSSSRTRTKSRPGSCD